MKDFGIVLEWKCQDSTLNTKADIAALAVISAFDNCFD